MGFRSGSSCGWIYGIYTLVGRWHQTEPPAVNDDHVAVTVGPCAAGEIQDGATHFFGSADSLRGDLLLGKDSVADETGG